MSDERILSFKTVEKVKEKTLPEVLTKLVEDWKEEGNTDYDDYRIGAIIVETKFGIRVIPLKEETSYSYIGLLEVAKMILVDNIYDDEEG